MRLFSEAFHRIKQNFADEVDDKKLIESCVAGMVSGIDPDSAYLDKSKFNSLKAGSQKTIGGIGVNLSIKNSFPIVISAIEDTPSYFSGIKSGDVILQINENNMQGVRLDDVVSQIRGYPGESVRLTIAREGNNKPIVFDIERKQIRIRSVKYKILENNIGYIRITTFSGNTGKAFKKSLNKLVSQSKNKLNGLVIDLRNNPGGLLDQAIVVADTFLSDGLIAYAESKNSGSDLKFTAKKAVMLEGTPLVILVNKGSAAASEIVSAALRDHNRATIIGEKTFGRASIQMLMPLLNGGALKLTTSRWRTPNGDYIHGRGIEPDIVVSNSSTLRDDIQLKKAVNVIKGIKN